MLLEHSEKCLGSRLALFCGRGGSDPKSFEQKGHPGCRSLFDVRLRQEHVLYPERAFNVWYVHEQRPDGARSSRGKMVRCLEWKATAQMAVSHVDSKISKEGHHSISSTQLPRPFNRPQNKRGSLSPSPMDPARWRWWWGTIIASARLVVTTPSAATDRYPTTLNTALPFVDL